MMFTNYLKESKDIILYEYKIFYEEVFSHISLK